MVAALSTNDTVVANRLVDVVILVSRIVIDLSSLWRAGIVTQLVDTLDVVPNHAYIPLQQAQVA